MQNIVSPTCHNQMAYYDMLFNASSHASRCNAMNPNPIMGKGKQTYHQSRCDASVLPYERHFATMHLALSSRCRKATVTPVHLRTDLLLPMLTGFEQGLCLVLLRRLPMGLAKGLNLVLIHRQDHSPFAGTAVTQNGRVIRLVFR